MLLRKQVEKIEAFMPVPLGTLMERLDRQSLDVLCHSYQELTRKVLRSASRRKQWSPEHIAAVERYDQSYGKQLEEVSDEELKALIAHWELARSKQTRKIAAGS